MNYKHGNIYFDELFDDWACLEAIPVHVYWESITRLGVGLRDRVLMPMLHSPTNTVVKFYDPRTRKTLISNATIRSIQGMTVSLEEATIRHLSGEGLPDTFQIPYTIITKTLADYNRIVSTGKLHVCYTLQSDR